MSNQQQNPQPDHNSSNHRESPPRWPDIPTALCDPLFPKALTQQCTRFSRDPEEAAGSTLVILSHPKIIDRYDPCRGSVMTFSVAIAWRANANMHRRQAKMRTGLQCEPCTRSDSFMRHLIAREHLSLVLVEISNWPSADQDLLWRGAHCRYCRDYPPMTGTERARLHRLRRKLAELID